MNHSWWLPHWLGLDNAAGAFYLWWSGIEGDLVQLAIIGGLYAFIRKHNCHQTGCWRVGRFQAGDFHTCRRHHPDPNVREGLQAHHIRASHERRISS